MDASNVFVFGNRTSPKAHTSFFALTGPMPRIIPEPRFQFRSRSGRPATNRKGLSLSFAHERLKAHLRELVEPRIKEHRGRIVKNTGDGLSAEFARVVDAVRCAVKGQRGMIDRDPDVAEDSRIRFRIGRHPCARAVYRQRLSYTPVLVRLSRCVLNRRNVSELPDTNSAKSRPVLWRVRLIL